jgi:hypothetical protein
MADNKGYTGADYAAAYDRLQNYKAVAREMGVHEKTVRDAVKRFKARDPAMQGAMDAVGTGLVPSLAWIKTKATADAPGYSIMLRPPEETPEDIADRIADRINGIVAAPAIQRPASCSSDLLNLLPIFDVHLGQRVGSFGTAQAVDRLREGFRDVIDRAPRASTTVILNGGDFTEANDNSAQTPASRHPLAVDIDFDDISDVAVDLTAEMIDYALSVSERVVYQGLKGNHDPAMGVVLRQALRMRYREEPRFELLDGLDLFTFEWEGNLLAGIHGDQKVSKAESLTLAIAARHASAWGNSRNRELWRGHRHSELSIAVPGMTLYRVNPICPPGRYANENLYTGQSDIQCVTYGKGGGRRASTVHIFQD